ncbi:hypothetical protein RND81_13G191200 [Saponaria officinalis]|uniref:LOB domain-containing protein n=1 Tax=Saponaria officinalis TaxID=3572 RepID=A0AAW1H2C7_SAPOF
MSCNGCRVLRKGCSETCILRPCLQWMDTADSQGYATAFVAKFFGRVGLMSLLSNVPPHHRPALFQSLLYEACGRTVNPVSGAVGLMWTGNWHVCQSAVETVLQGGTLSPIPEYLDSSPSYPETPDTSEVSDIVRPPKHSTAVNMSRDVKYCCETTSYVNTSFARFTNSKRHRPAAVDIHKHQQQKPQQRMRTPLFKSEESVMTVSFESGLSAHNYRYQASKPELLNLFV